MRAFCSVPLLSHDRVLGALDMGRRREEPFSPEEVELLGEVAKQIAIAVENAQAYRQITELKDRLAKENLYLEEEVRTEHNFGEIVGDSAALRRVLKEVETVAPTDSTVLIRGETGTGKELIARALHDLSPRRDRTFVKLNCAAIPTGLLESELFGHEKGAFTGAITQKVGRFELAHQGTLFLDEVGDIPLELQPKLLRALQEQEFERLGSTRTIRVDVRLVAATNRDLAQMVADGRVPQRPLLPPERVPRRAAAACASAATTSRCSPATSPSGSRSGMGRRIETIPTAVMDALVRYPWPGNIREMQNVIERAVILSRGPELKIPLSEFKQQTKAASANLSSSLSTLEEAEREHILRALGGNPLDPRGPCGCSIKTRNEAHNSSIADAQARHCTISVH